MTLDSRPVTSLLARRRSAGAHARVGWLAWCAVGLVTVACTPGEASSATPTSTIGTATSDATTTTSQPSTPPPDVTAASTTAPTTPSTTDPAPTTAPPEPTSTSASSEPPLTRVATWIVSRCSASCGATNCTRFRSLQSSSGWTVTATSYTITAPRSTTLWCWFQVEASCLLTASPPGKCSPLVTESPIGPEPRRLRATPARTTTRSGA